MAEKPVLQTVRETLERHRKDHGGLLAILEEIQAQNGYLSEDALRAVAEGTGRPLVDVYGVATFYRSFSLKPRGKHYILACQGTACHVRGASVIVEELERQLGIKAGNTTPDNEFTLETANCLGACALGPVVVIDGQYFSKVRKSHIAQLIADAHNGVLQAKDGGDRRAEDPDPVDFARNEPLKRLSTIDEFNALRERLRSGDDSELPTIIIPAGTCGQASGANDLIRAAKRAILAKGLTQSVRLRVTGCHGFCEMEPSVLVEPGGIFYPKVDPKDLPRIIEAALHKQVLKDLCFRDPVTGESVPRQRDVPFFKKQLRAILGQNEKVDPVRIRDYIASGGYSALADVLSKGDPESVVAEVQASGLRGRGGAGFPTGLKWKFLADQPGPQGKFLVCNADEGDPGAYMDRCVLEGNPQSIIEGMIIGARGTGATEGVVYVRNEYPLAIRNLTAALTQARELGLLGKDILSTGFSFDIRVATGAGAFVCGEETALIRSVEGKMGEPRQRPPFPIQKGIDGKPTAINNVETWANIPLIFRQGAAEYARVGTKGNSGTKIFSLVGKVRNTGLVEVPMGITIEEIVHDIGGGAPGKARIKAVQTGGPSGGCIPADKFGLRIDYDSLAQAGSIMGSGGMIVMDENTCMVDVARYFENFLKDESCGKCFTCRKGTQRMYEILDDVSKGQGTLGQLDLLKELADVVKDTTMCGLGQTASNPVLSTLRYYRHEYERHIVDKRCDAFVCNELVGASCQAACPLGTEVWRYVALIQKGRYQEAYRVIRAPNPFPSVCARVCGHKCESRCRLGTTGGEPIAIRALKRFITDHVDPSSYKPARTPRRDDAAKVAVVGAGPAGLTAAHRLSLMGYGVTIFEAGAEPGGMLLSCIPAYRLPRDVVRKEIAALMDENITLKCDIALGRDLSLDDLFAQGFKAVFLAIGADKSWPLGIEGEDLKGVYSSMDFLKAFNLRSEELAFGHVGVIGGGNSAVDAARIAIRQKDVKSVTLYYRRTSQEMPAYIDEVDAAQEEGISLETLVSPVRVRQIEQARKEGVKVEDAVLPVRIDSKEGRVTGIECVRNQLGEVDSSGRRRPVPISGSEFHAPVDTLIAAIGERPDSDGLASMGLEINRNGTLRVDDRTLSTSRPGVFAGGDLVSGPSMVVDAVAHGQMAATMIDRYLRGVELKETPKAVRPDVFVEPSEVGDEELGESARVVLPVLPAEARKKGCAEVEMVLTREMAACEARRCLRCDLQFTQPAEAEADREAQVEARG
jgi:NADH-quinone oxidoreductase subunit F